MATTNGCPKITGHKKLECNVSLKRFDRVLTFNSKTKEIFDEFENLIGYVELKDGKLIVKRKK